MIPDPTAHSHDVFHLLFPENHQATPQEETKNPAFTYYYIRILITYKIYFEVNMFSELSNCLNNLTCMDIYVYVHAHVLVRVHVRVCVCIHICL